MTTHKASITWDNQKHAAVHLGMTNHGESDAAYLRKCVEFYEMNKGSATNQQIILERLTSIERMLKRGVVVGDNNSAPENKNDELFDNLLSQLE